MNVALLLGTLRERGAELRADGERLRVVAEPGAITPELADAIRAHKAEILELLRNVAPADVSAGGLPRASERTCYPLSITQGRAAVSAREGAVLPTAFRLRGALDAGVLERTLQQIVDRHATLRSRFELDRDEPVQHVQPEVGVQLGLTDLSALPASTQDARLLALLDEQRAQRFDVGRPPLFRFHLFRKSPDEHVLFAAFSPLVFDGWSFDVFWNELRFGYPALAAGKPFPLPALQVEYADYVAFQTQRLSEREALLERFWRQRLGEQLPPLPLPTDHPRPRVPSHKGGNLVFELPSATTLALRKYAREHHVTPQMIMLAGMYALVARLGGERELIVATPVEARIHPSLETLIGPFVNILLLPLRVDLELPFSRFVVQVRDECLTAYDHQEYPIERLRVRSRPNPSGGIAPAFQVEFSFQQVSQRGSHMGPLSLSQLELQSGAATNDLTLWVKDWGDRIAGALEFKSDLYDRETIQHWSQCYTHYLHELVQAPETKISELPWLGSELERVQAAAARASVAMPAWVSSALEARLPKGPVSLRVVDEHGQPRPLGTIGTLEVTADGKTLQTGLLAKLTHDGKLVPASAAAALGVSVSAAPKVPKTPPRTDLERQMTTLFGELLEVSDVGVHDTFFELGGNSLIAVRLFGEIHKRFGVRLPAATILEADTPAALARLITDHFPNRESCLVKLKAGTGERCLFLVHDADGETLLYLNLARRMPDSVSVFGIEPLRVGPVPMAHTTLRECAEHYIHEMKLQQREGPYFVGGLCAGGLIGYEIARQLVAQGDEVGALLLFDAAPPTAAKKVTVAGQRMDVLKELLSDLRPSTLVGTASVLGRKVVRTVSYEQKARLSRLRADTAVLLQRKVFKRGMGWPAGLAPASAREIFAHAEAEFEPSVLRHVNAYLFRSTEDMSSQTRNNGENDRPFKDLLADEDFGWQPLLERKVTIIDTPGGHSSMLRVPHVEAFAAHLRKIIEPHASVAPTRAATSTEEPRSHHGA